MLKRITLLRDRVESWNAYPFTVAALRDLDSIDLRSRVCFLVGENGSGKSTLLEAVAAHYGFGREGGTRNFQNDSTASNSSVEPLVKVLRLSFDRRTGRGFFFRAESFFNVATYIDELDSEPALDSPPVSDFYGGVSLHSHSHGESFFTLFANKCQRDGLYLLDEPEAALSPARQLAFLVLLHDVLRTRRDAQFIIATHSPILLGFPNAQILSFDEGALREIPYEQTAPYTIVRRFVNDREQLLGELFAEEPPAQRSIFEQAEPDPQQ